MTARALRTAVALLLETAALALLVLVALGHPWPVLRDPVAVYVLADRSSSVSPRELQRAFDDVLRSLSRAPPVALYAIDFAGRSGPLRPVTSAADAARVPATARLATDATNIADALRRATTITTTPRPAAIVVLSDGNSTAGDPVPTLEDAATAGIPVLWRSVGGDASSPRIAEVLAPARARAGQPIPIQIRLAGRTRRPTRVTVTSRADAVAPAAATIAAGALGTATVQLVSRVPGPLQIDVALMDVESSRALDASRPAAVVDVQASAKVLYVADEPTALADSLRAGGWSITTVPSRRLDALAGALGQYDAMVLDDVPASAARPATWDAVAETVRERGLGLLVLGGARSFSAGAYADSRLDALLPVRSRPAGLGDATAFAFVVDKSGSMGASTAGIDRFQLAQRAVVETAGALTDRDSAALVVFDVAARNLVPLQPAARFRQAVGAPWPAQPRGGTRAATALEMAVAQLEGAAAGRRILVLVTDGFLEAAAIDHLRARLAQARVELIALAVGPDADTRLLAGLVEPGRGTILRVGEAAELPALMRSSVDSRRAPVERGRLPVRRLQALKFMPAGTGDWPAIAAYAVTSPADGAVVYLESERGDPLLAFRQQGLGRIVVVTCGLGAWTPEWLRWKRWPALAGGLVDWVVSPEPPRGLAIRASDTPDGLRIDVDTATDNRWEERVPAGLRVQDPTGRVSGVRLDASAPGRASALLSDPRPGLYTFAVTTSAGTQRLTYLRRPSSESAWMGPGPAIGAWQHVGLIRELSTTDLLATIRAASGPVSGPERALLLATALFLLGVLIDRFPGRRRRTVR